MLKIRYPINEKIKVVGETVMKINSAQGCSSCEIEFNIKLSDNLKNFVLNRIQSILIIICVHWHNRFVVEPDKVSGLWSL
jgi:hypothetical protein